MITRNQEKMAEIISLLEKIPKPSNKKSDEKSDTTDMPDLQSEKSAEQNKKQRGVGLKMLTPD